MTYRAAVAEGTVQRVCFQLTVRPDRIEEYVERHAAVWPEMLEALERAGWHNYSLFLRPDGLLIGYVETPSLERALAAMEATEVNARWQAEMAEFFEDLDDARPDTGFVQLAEVFHLEDRLARHRPSPEPARDRVRCESPTDHDREVM
jgi:L-rhamnose mutarotase